MEDSERPIAPSGWVIDTHDRFPLRTESRRGKTHSCVLDVGTACACCGRARGGFTVWDIMFACYVDRDEDDDSGDEDQEKGRDWHIVLRFAVSAPNAAGAAHLRVDSWVGPTADSDKEETVSGVGAPIDEGNVVVVPGATDNHPVFVNLPSLSTTNRTLSPQVTLIVDRIDDRRILVTPLGAMSVAYMHTRLLYGRIFSERRPDSRPPSTPKLVPSFIPEPPPMPAPDACRSPPARA